LTIKHIAGTKLPWFIRLYDTQPGNEVGLFYNGPEHHMGKSEGCQRIESILPPWKQISSLTTLASAQWNTVRTENIESTSWKLLHTSSGHALTMMMMNLTTAT